MTHMASPPNCSRNRTTSTTISDSGQSVHRMDPRQNQRDQEDQRKQEDLYLRDGASPLPERHASGAVQPPPTDTRNQQAAARQPRYSGGFTVIPPNESLRSRIQTTAQKEEEALQRYREAHRPASVHLNPEKLGGDLSLAEARDRQSISLRCSKLQKKLKKEELDKRRRQEEEEELQKMKAIQRDKSERLEAKKREDQAKRKEQHQEDHSRRNESFLQRIESKATRPSSNATLTSSRPEDVENKQKETKSTRDVELDRKRVNTAFLDKLESQSRGGEKETKKESAVEAERPSLAPDDLGQQATTTGRGLLSHLKPGSEQRCSSWTEEADAEPDYDWALMKLITNFPDCTKDFLEDILSQCDGDYEQAYTLLICTLS